MIYLNENPKIWKKCHVYEFVNYLNSRGARINLYEHVNKQSYILHDCGEVVFLNDTAEVCLMLKELYINEKRSHEVAVLERFKQRIKEKEN